jgi:hypothetical protein
MPDRVKANANPDAHFAGVCSPSAANGHFPKGFAELNPGDLQLILGV